MRTGKRGDVDPDADAGAGDHEMMCKASDRDEGFTGRFG